MGVIFACFQLLGTWAELKDWEKSRDNGKASSLRASTRTNEWRPSIPGGLCLSRDAKEFSIAVDEKISAPNWDFAAVNCSSNGFSPGESTLNTEKNCWLSIFAISTPFEVSFPVRSSRARIWILHFFCLLIWQYNNLGFDLHLEMMLIS